MNIPQVEAELFHAHYW